MLHADALLPYTGEGEAAALVTSRNRGPRLRAGVRQVLVCGCLHPNAQNELARIDVRMAWDDAYRGFLSALERETGKPVVTCGDFNVAR